MITFIPRHHSGFGSPGKAAARPAVTGPVPALLGRMMGFQSALRLGFVPVFALVACLAVQGRAAEFMPAAEIRRAFLEFQSDPKTFMNRRPEKRVARGRGITLESAAKFAPKAIADGSYIGVKDQLRRRLCGPACLPDAEQGARSAIRGNDRPEDLVDISPLLQTLEAMQAREVMSGSVDRTPWSGDYWPYYKGVLGWRFNDPEFPASSDWSQNLRYVQDHPASGLFHSGNGEAVDQLSPAEKYDALVGDPQGTLASRMWAMGRPYHEAEGAVATWMGICEGWAAAAMMLDRPVRTVSALAADGRTRLRFHPSDLKALASLLWARGLASVRFIGGRCPVQAPQEDGNGRNISEDCFDTNPATWHLSIVNQVGVVRRSLILDATYDYEVWNQPVWGYQYWYFNPVTGEATWDIHQARVALSSLSWDRFRRFRSSAAVWIVGIAMDVTYMDETRASAVTTDSPSQDAARTVRYLYDLELDSAGKIIGGEWYTNFHPDFLWLPPAGARAVSSGDAELPSEEVWNGVGRVPPSWQVIARRTSARTQPLAAIVERLLERAK